MKRGIFAALILWLLLPLDTAFAKGDLPPPKPTWNYHGMWWGSPAGSESGWAIGISHQGETIRATWFTYDKDGTPMWLVMPEGGRRTYGWASDAYTGNLYRTNAEPRDQSRVNMTLVGTASFMFGGSANATFTYVVNGTFGSKLIEKQAVAARVPTCGIGAAQGSVPNYTDLWGLQSGWGVHIAHQGDVVFATWFAYRADGKGEWLVMPNGVRIDALTYSGTLYRTRGPAFDAIPWKPSNVVAAPVGHATFTIVKEYESAEASDSYREYAMFDFVLDGVSGSRAITRQVFAGPVSVCSGS